MTTITFNVDPTHHTFNATAQAAFEAKKAWIAAVDKLHEAQAVEVAAATLVDQTERALANYVSSPIEKRRTLLPLADSTFMLIEYNMYDPGQPNCTHLSVHQSMSNEP